MPVRMGRDHRRVGDHFMDCLPIPENLSINTNTTDMLSEELLFRQRYIEYGDAFLS